MTELETLTVNGPTQVGWCDRTPPNETVDQNGEPFPEQVGFGVADPRAPGRRAYDDPQVMQLREHLREHNGLRRLEICDPDEVEHAARIFRRDGFVVVRDLLDAERLELFREGSVRVLRQILELAGFAGRKYVTETGRLPHRYSYGTASASRQLLHDPVWASMIDLPTTTPILEAIFGDEYLVVGAGGDLCLPGAIEYQHLHADVIEDNVITEERRRYAERVGIEFSTREGSDELDVRTVRSIVERTPPVVTINFLMSDLTWENGPIRQIPGTQASAFAPPTPQDEPEWMRLSTLVGAPAGAGVFRDNRAWHGATPNLSREVRAMPNVEYGALSVPEERFRHKTMPHEIWETLSPHAQRVSRRVKAEPGVWPAGAGVMHPLAARRREVKKGEPA